MLESNKLLLLMRGGLPCAYPDACIVGYLFGKYSGGDMCVFWVGSGTEAEPYLITSLSHIQAIMNNTGFYKYKDKHSLQTTGIRLGDEWMSTGTRSSREHKITGLKWLRYDTYRSVQLYFWLGREIQKPTCETYLETRRLCSNMYNILVILRVE